MSASLAPVCYGVVSRVESVFSGEVCVHGGSTYTYGQAAYGIRDSNACVDRTRALQRRRLLSIYEFKTAATTRVRCDIGANFHHGA